ncbi:MAG: hypothetical protein ACM31C_30545 [Acidobacteriota bacterium]
MWRGIDLALRFVYVALVVLMVATAGYGYWNTRHARTMTFTTWLRLKERTMYARVRMIRCEMVHPDRLDSCLGHDAELRAMADALRAAREQTTYKAALGAARDTLTKYYKPDEAAAFRLYADHGLLVLYAHYAGKPAIWLGAYTNHFLIYPSQLPASLRKALDL